MNGAISASPEALGEVPLDDGRPAIIRRADRADASRVLAFGGSPGAHYLCRMHAGRAPAQPGDAGELLLAVLPGGGLAGAAWFRPLDDDRAEYAAFVQAGYGRYPLAAILLRLLADAARARGYRTFVTSISSDGGDPFAAFRAAGLRLASCVSLGGASDVTLGLD